MRRLRTAVFGVALLALLALLALGAGCARTVTVPEVSGLTLPQASQTLVEAHLAVGQVTEAASDDVAAGLVLSQDPSAGEAVPVSTAVALTVSSGPALVTVPTVIGMTPEEATAALEAAGLAVEEHVADGPVDPDAGEADVGRVYRQTPPAGTKVPKGTVIEIRYWFESGG